MLLPSLPTSHQDQEPGAKLLQVVTSTKVAMDWGQPLLQTLPQCTWRGMSCSMPSPPYSTSSSRKPSQTDRGLAFSDLSLTRTLCGQGELSVLLQMR